MSHSRDGEGRTHAPPAWLNGCYVREIIDRASLFLGYLVLAVAGLDGPRASPSSGGLSHHRPKSIVDQVPPASIRAAAHDIACRAFEVYVLAVGTCAIN